MSIEARTAELKAKHTKQQLAEMVASAIEFTTTRTEHPSLIGEREKQILWCSGYYKEQGRKPGSFYRVLIDCFFKADRSNFQRLKLAFPTTAQAFENYMSGSLKEKYNLPED